jgi:hypothetical protein
MGRLISPVLLANPGMAKLYNSSDFSDVVVRCGKQEIKAHKVVLCSHSDTFRTAFHNQEGWAVILSTCTYFRVYILQNIWSLAIQLDNVQ